MGKIIILFLLVSINIYSPYTVYSPVIFNVIFIVFYTLRDGNFHKFSNLQKKAIFFSILILIWTIIVSIFNLNFDFYVLGKFLRVVINTILLSLIFNNIKLTRRKFIIVLLFVLFLNTVSVYLQNYLPASKELFMPLTGFHKKIVELRSFGLFSSYDFTGLATCILMLLSWNLFQSNKKIIYLVVFFLTFFSTLFISRFTMIIAIIIFSIFMFKYLFKRGKSFIKYFLFMPLVFITSYKIILKIYDLILLSTISIASTGISSSYSSKSSDVLLDGMTFLPDSILSSIIGLGESVDSSDIGYIKLIFMIGFIGLSMIIFSYFKLFKLLQAHFKRYVLENDFFLNRDLTFFKWFILIMFVFNFKLLFIYSRGFHELFLIILFVFEKSVKKRPIKPLSIYGK